MAKHRCHRDCGFPFSALRSCRASLPALPAMLAIADRTLSPETRNGRALEEPWKLHRLSDGD